MRWRLHENVKRKGTMKDVKERREEGSEEGSETLRIRIPIR
jgi:hypothetical protein